MSRPENSPIIARVLKAALLLMALAGTAGSSLAAPYSCEGYDFNMPGITVILQNAYEDKKGNFIGVFELHNYDYEPWVELSGRFEDKILMMRPPEATVEFAHFYNTPWKPLRMPAVKHPKSTDKLRVKPNSKITFKAHLFPKKLVQTGEPKFMLVLKKTKPVKCIISLPFTTVPPRQALTGLVSQPVEPRSPVAMPK